MKKFVNYTHYKAMVDIKRLKFIQDSIGKFKGDHLNIIDIGCGNGHIAYQLACNGHKVKGIDISANAISKANTLYQCKNLTYEVSIAERLKDEPLYDVVVMSEVLEHLEDPSSVLDVVAGMIKPDGIVLVTVPNGFGPREVLITKPVQKIYKTQSPLAKILKYFKSLLGYKGLTEQTDSETLEHIQFFSYRSLNMLASECGLEIIKLGTANFLDEIFPFSFITRRNFAMQCFDCWVADQIPSRFTSGFNTVMAKKQINI